MTTYNPMKLLQRFDLKNKETLLIKSADLLTVYLKTINK